MNRFEVVLPRSAAEAAQLVKEGGDRAALKAGGIDLLDRLKEGSFAPTRLVNLVAVPGLREIDFGLGAAGLRVGALVTLAQLAGHAGVQRQYAALAEAAASAANPQIRNIATVGGNLCQRPRCWYFRSPDFKCLKKGGATCFAKVGENRYHAIFGGGPSYVVHASSLATALVALGGRVKTVAPDGKEREIALDGFFTLPKDDYDRENVLAAGEVITEILVPAPPAGARSAFLAVKEKAVYDWPLAEVAVMLVAAGGAASQARVVLGAAAPIPWRAKGAESALAGRKIGADSAEKAGHAAVVGAQPLAQNGYKVPLFAALVRRTVLAAAGRGP